MICASEAVRSRKLMDSRRNTTDVRCSFSMRKDRFAACVKQNLSQIFLSSSSALFCSPLFSAGWMEGALMWHSQCCDRTPKRNQMLFGLACGSEAYIYIYIYK